MKRSQLNARLLAVLFLAIFLLSIGNFFVYSHLLGKLQEEEAVINRQQMDSVCMKLSTALETVREDYITMTRQESFQRVSDIGPDYYTVMQLTKDAQAVYQTTPYVNGWMVFFRSSEYAATSNGCYSAGEYIRQFYGHPAYDYSFYNRQMNSDVPVTYLPAAEFDSVVPSVNAPEGQLLPMLIQNVWDKNMLAVFMLDIDKLCREKDPYLTENMYIFTESGTPVYHSADATPLDEIPQGKKDSLFAVESRWEEGGLVYVKLLPESQAMEQVRENFLLCLGVAAVALIVAVALGAVSIRRVMDPVNKMVGMLHPHAPEEKDNVRGAYTALESLLASREQLSEALAEKEAALTEYFLQSRLKNVYVGMQRQEEPEDNEAYILYIQVLYEEKNRNLFSMSWAELENCLQEMMTASLSSIFSSAILFQLEPGKFIARVALTEEQGEISALMEKFMHRLAQEQEFACFTVVQSEKLGGDTDLAAVYSAVQEASRMAVVKQESQLLTLPLPEKQIPYQYTYQDEQRLYGHARAGQPSEAVAIANQILDNNLSRGICHRQMEMLCVALVNTTSYAITEADKESAQSAASGVYNVLTSKCNTAKQYLDAVIGFIRTVVISQETEQEETEQDTLLLKIRQYLKENYHRELTIEEMAAALWVSRSYLSSYYKTKTGENLSESIQLYRVQQAEILLKDPTVKIGQVGAMVGIPSSNTFLRQFKKYTGMTPKEYRLKHNIHGNS